jgi:cytochrome P450
LLLVLAFSAGSAVGRLFGLFVDGSWGFLHLTFLSGEIACSYIAVKQWRRVCRRQQLKPVVANPVKLADFDPLSKACLENPYPFYKAMRDEAPVYKIPGADYVCISRYEDVKNVALNTDDYSSNLVSIILSTVEGSTKTINQIQSDLAPVDVLAIQDPPRHSEQRKLGLANLSMRFVQSLEGDIRSMADGIIDRFIERGEADWVKEFAKEIPMRVSLRLVGFPEDNWQSVKHWCDEAIGLLSGVNTPEDFARNSQTSMKLIGFVRKEYFAIKTAVAAGDTQQNFSSALMRAVDDPDYELTEAEAISMVFQVVIAGSDSTANTIGNSVKMLAENPDVQLALRKDPGKILAFIEEVLRLESPFQGHFRKTTRAVAIHGQTLPVGTRVMLLWASANRDEREYSDPERIDLQRHNLKHHLAFGRGIHQCLGANLARLEVRVALEQLLARTSLLVLDTTKPQMVDHVHSVFIRELNSLPIRFA